MTNSGESLQEGEGVIWGNVLSFASRAVGRN